MTKKIEVLDAIMGSGKTQGIIKWMRDNPQNKYLYVSPMLTEVEERIPAACASLEFVFPTTENHKTKSSNLLALLIEGRNIAFTHKLFKDLSKAHLVNIKRQGYVLVIDEELGLLESYSGVYKKGDITSLEQAGHIEVDENNLGIVKWLWKNIDEDTAYSSLKRLCELEMLYCAKRSRDMMVIQLPMALVQSSYRTIVLTYLFEGSVMESFLKLRGVEIVPFKEVSLTKDPGKIKREAKSLISLCTTPSTKAIREYSLSSTWYSTNAKREQLTKVARAIYSIYRKNEHGSILFTMPKDSTIKKSTTGKPNARCAVHASVDADNHFLYCSARATNDYSDRSVAVHAYNRYINTVVTSYFRDYGKDIGATPSDDQFALSEMLQWTWRTRIRKDEKIELYVLSERMESLLKNWLNS